VRERKGTWEEERDRLRGSRRERFSLWKERKNCRLDLDVQMPMY